MMDRPILIIHVFFHRYGHALAVAGNVAFLFGGASSINQEVTLSLYNADFFLSNSNLPLFTDLHINTVGLHSKTWLKHLDGNGLLIFFLFI